MEQSEAEECIVMLAAETSGTDPAPAVAELYRYTHSDVIMRYVPTEDNPADIGSRGTNSQKLQAMTKWWSGPDFLKLEEAAWSVQLTNHPMQRYQKMCLKKSMTNAQNTIVIPQSCPKQHHHSSRF
ncbi:hypothetical protein OSTOST_01496 [Ostertagia ostertagi]